MQQLDGKPVLTWWQGYIPKQGFGEGEEIIDNAAYQQIGRVHAGNGYKADLHDFNLTPDDTALLTVFNPIDCNLSSDGGPTGGAVTDSMFQEIDLHTGLVRREWHSLDHVPLRRLLQLLRRTPATEWPFDYFHINSIDQSANGTTLISARNTWALYELNTTTGQIQSTIGGKRSSVKIGAGTRTAYQHDATTLAERQDQRVRQRRGAEGPSAVARLRAGARRADEHDDAGLAVRAQPGAVVRQPGKHADARKTADIFIGWGSEPYFSEFSSSGQLLFDAHMHGATSPTAPTASPGRARRRAPRRSRRATLGGGRSTVYASWNGDTRTASWRVLAGATRRNSHR